MLDDPQSGKALRISPRATLDTIKKTFANAWFAPPGRIYSADIDAMIPMMGRTDISDVQNELIAFLSVGQFHAYDPRRWC